jgi:hypothetical protein
VGNLIEKSEVYQNLIVPELRSINNALKDLKGGSCIKIDPRAADFFLNEFYRFNAFPMERLGNDLQYSDKIRFALRALVISVLIRMQEQLNLENSTSPQELDDYTPETFIAAFPKLFPQKSSQTRFIHEEFPIVMNFRRLLLIAWQFIDPKENNKWVLIHAISGLLETIVGSKGGGQTHLNRCLSEVFDKEREKRIHPQLPRTTSSLIAITAFPSQLTEESPFLNTTSTSTAFPFQFAEGNQLRPLIMNTDIANTTSEHFEYEPIPTTAFLQEMSRLPVEYQISFSNTNGSIDGYNNNDNNNNNNFSGGLDSINLLPNDVSHTSIFPPSTTTIDTQTEYVPNTLYSSNTTATTTSSSCNDFDLKQNFDQEELYIYLAESLGCFDDI